MQKLSKTTAILITILFLSGFKNSTDLIKTDNTMKLKTFHDFTVKDINGNDYNLARLKGKKVMVVNTASECGLTPQYEILQKIYETLDTNKFEIIAFPANNFLSQEPGTNKDIKEFCQINFGITFPIMSKVSVCNYIYNSYPPDINKSSPTQTDEIYQWLTKKNLNGVMDTDIKWNFQKFLIDEEGKLIGTLAPNIAAEILTLKSWFE